MTKPTMTRRERRYPLKDLITAEYGDAADLAQLDAEHAGPGHVLVDGCLADPGRRAHLTHAEPQLVRQPQYFTDLPHRHSHRWHQPPHCFVDRGWR